MSDNTSSSEMLSLLILEIERLRDAEVLLKNVHIEHGAYGDRKISDETRGKINNFFHFDDSE